MGGTLGDDERQMYSTKEGHVQREAEKKKSHGNGKGALLRALLRTEDQEAASLKTEI